MEPRFGQGNRRTEHSFAQVPEGTKPRSAFDRSCGVKGTFDEIVLSPWLTADTDAWFILTDAEDGLQYYDRTPLEFDQDLSFLNEVTRYKAYMRFVTGYSDPRGIYGSSGA